MLAEVIRFHCPHCGRRIKVLAHFAGSTGKCPDCGVGFVVPTPDESRAADGALGLQPEQPSQPAHIATRATDELDELASAAAQSSGRAPPRLPLNHAALPQPWHPDPPYTHTPPPPVPLQPHPSRSAGAAPARRPPAILIGAALVGCALLIGVAALSRVITTRSPTPADARRQSGSPAAPSAERTPENAAGNARDRAQSASPPAPASPRPDNAAGRAADAPTPSRPDDGKTLGRSPNDLRRHLGRPYTRKRDRYFNIYDWEWPGFFARVAAASDDAPVDGVDVALDIRPQFTADQRTWEQVAGLVEFLNDGRLEEGKALDWFTTIGKQLGEKEGGAYSALFGRTVVSVESAEPKQHPRGITIRITRNRGP